MIEIALTGFALLGTVGALGAFAWVGWEMYKETRFWKRVAERNMRFFVHDMQLVREVNKGETRG